MLQDITPIGATLLVVGPEKQQLEEDSHPYILHHKQPSGV